jgi:CBS-domain-containing membrane protein
MLVVSHGAGHDLRRDALRLIWCAAGLTAGLGLALWAVFPPESPLLLASLGGSAIFLFGLTRAPAAQPRALFGGHLGGALIGILCGQCFGDALWVYPLAGTLTLVFMLLARTVHPPAGATPLILLHHHAGFAALWHPVGLAVLVLALTAAAWSRMVPGALHYPVAWFEKSPPANWWGAWDDRPDTPR